jgi:hypothetical protein
MGPTRTGEPISSIPHYQGRRPIGSGQIGAVLATRVRPVSSSRDQLLPVLPALGPLFTQGGLQRGTVVAVDAGNPRDSGRAGEGPGGSTSLAFALLATASTASWCAAVGVTDPGLVALAGLEVDLAHLVLVPDPGPRWPDATASLLDGMDIVLVRPPRSVRPGVARRLAARARERRAVLVVLGTGAWPEGADARLAVGAGGWQGLESGHGHLRGRSVEVVSSGRRAAIRPVRVSLWLPAASGRVEAIGDEQLHKQSTRQLHKQ